jgi:hypothetical protein
VRTGAGHGIDLAPLADQPQPGQVFDPVNQAVRHDVQRHFELSARHLLLRVIVHEREERSECHRVQHALHGGFMASGGLRHGGERGFAALRVGEFKLRIDFELATGNG